MRQITTVTGPILPTQMGHCQTHEHLFVADTPAASANPALRIDREELSASEARDFAEKGGGTLVDCQPVGAGRNIQALRRISLASGVNIVSVTGYHLPVFYPKGHWIFSDGLEALSERFAVELQAGAVDEAGGEVAFPGAVKAAVGPQGPEGRFKTCLAAAARAAALADVPLILHTEYGKGAVEAVSICEQNALPPSRIAVCHADRQASDYAVHEAIAQTGAYLEYDTIARYKYHDDDSEVRLIRHMLDRGYENRLLISLDTTAARMKRYGGAPGLGSILDTFLPMLQDAGIGRETLETITRSNPERIFTCRQ